MHCYEAFVVHIHNMHFIFFRYNERQVMVGNILTDLTPYTVQL